MPNNVVCKENLNLLFKNTKELLKEIDSPKREYNQLKKKIDVLNNILSPLLQCLLLQSFQEDNTITLLTVVSAGLKVALQGLENLIKPTEVKTDSCTLRVSSFFNHSPEVPKATPQPIIHLQSSSNLLERWLENKKWLEKEELKHLKP